jgi:hypothetical protein
MSRTKGAVSLARPQDKAKVIPLTPEEEATLDVEEAAWEEEKPARAMASLRTERNTLLTESDWTQYNDSPLDDETKGDWETYRQELRDLPATTEDPANPTWPSAPE